MAKIIDNIKIGVSPLTGNIHLYRHGKDPSCALEKRDAESDVMYALVQHLWYNTSDYEETVIKHFELDGQKYELSVTKIDKYPEGVE